MQDRQRECRGLPVSGLGDPDHVAAGQDGRYGLNLDRGWSEILLVRKRSRDCVAKFKILKRGQEETFYCARCRGR
jgi:hypothetical protein